MSFCSHNHLIVTVFVFRHLDVGLLQLLGRLWGNSLKLAVSCFWALYIVMQKILTLGKYFVSC